MILNRNRLYTLLSIACLAGYTWLYYNIWHQKTTPETSSVEVCLIKYTAGIPCPSCGSTRSILSITNGNFFEALAINPLGYIVITIMLFAPIWIFFDLVLKNESLFEFYQKTETFLKRPSFSIPIIMLLIANWIWNISKEL